MKKVIFVATTLDVDLGGIARSVPALALSVAAACEREVYLVAPRPQKSTLPLPEIVERSGLKVVLCDGASGVRLKLAELTRQTESVELIYHAGIWNPLNHHVAKLGRRKKIPVIVSTRSMLDPWALNYRRCKKWIAWHGYARRDLQSALAVHATAELEAGYIRMALAGKSPQVVVIPNGVELPEGLAADFGTRPDGPKRVRRILFLSRIHAKKGVLDLIHAFGGLNPAGWELWIAGNDDGHHQEQCEQVARAQVNSNCIHFPGPFSDAAKWAVYRESDIFVLPSYSENFGIVVGEALGSGLCVITTTATPWAEFASRSCEDKSASSLGLWITEPGQLALRKALESVLALSDTERSDCGAAGARWIHQTFSWAAVGSQFVQHFLNKSAIP